ncbi:hypothetical protein ACFWFQ_02390 [Nocardia salmonicida]|uniref:hypothetical protein n=1 Tax=Nocardia salmonicida TaxID=53431 RepID=UPI003665FCDA
MAASPEMAALIAAEDALLDRSMHPLNWQHETPDRAVRRTWPAAASDPLAELDADAKAALGAIGDSIDMTPVSVVDTKMETIHEI